ncbi:hypothetical protein ES703_31690 [subsurface metagenome]
MNGNEAQMTMMEDVRRMGEMNMLASTIVDRSRLAAFVGQSFGGDRKLYTEVGYPISLKYQNFEARWRRQDVAKRIINAYPDATWGNPPEVYETEGTTDETEFEKAWKTLLDNHRVWHYFQRADRLAGVYQYGVLLIGFKDGGELRDLVGTANELLYLQSYSQNKVDIDSKVKDSQDPRFGQPDIYNVTTDSDNSMLPVKVHWSRIIHIADDCDESDLLGTPRLEAVYNRLQDLETTVAGASEMFWKGGFPGWLFNVPSDVTLTTDQKDDMETEMTNYMHKLKRYLRLQGVDVKEMKQQLANPKGLVDVLLMLISGATGIPVRILTGSERGELASGQDENNWNSRVNERRRNFAEPSILRPFIDRLIMVGVLPKPKEGKYFVKWPSVSILSDKEQANIGLQKARAIKEYAGTFGSEQVLPVATFRTEILGLTVEQNIEIEKTMEEELDSEIDDEAEDAAKEEENGIEYT